MQARRENMERMAEVVPGSDEQVLQHFLSHSSWDERWVLDKVALEADALLGGSAESALLIDESGVTKKGTQRLAWPDTEMDGLVEVANEQSVWLTVRQCVSMNGLQLNRRRLGHG